MATISSPQSGLHTSVAFSLNGTNVAVSVSPVDVPLPGEALSQLESEEIT